MKKEKNITVNEENGQNERNANMTDEQSDGNVAVVITLHILLMIPGAVACLKSDEKCYFFPSFLLVMMICV